MVVVEVVVVIWYDVTGMESVGTVHSAVGGGWERRRVARAKGISRG